MLAKSTKKNKIMIYFVIIFVMISGTFFLVYKNYTLNSSKKISTIDIQLERIKLAEEEKIGLGKDTVVSSSNVSAINRIINLELLFDSRFKNLMENFAEPKEVKSGKRNPFIPY